MREVSICRLSSQPSRLSDALSLRAATAVLLDGILSGQLLAGLCPETLDIFCMALCSNGLMTGSGAISAGYVKSVSSQLLQAHNRSIRYTRT
jgi:hypothetical protein